MFTGLEPTAPPPPGGLLLGCDLDSGWQTRLALYRAAETHRYLHGELNDGCTRADPRRANACTVAVATSN